VSENTPARGQSSESDRRRGVEYETFVRARKRYWVDEARRLDPKLTVPSSEAIDVSDSQYIVSADGPDPIIAIFEDSGDVGWFYLYDSLEHRILNCTHVYNGSDVQVEPADVVLFWSDDRETSAVAVWDEMRAFLGVKNGVRVRAPIRSRDAPGIPANQWPGGFEYALLK
jgi:hypothetical protein